MRGEGAEPCADTVSRSAPSRSGNGSVTLRRVPQTAAKKKLRPLLYTVLGLLALLRIDGWLWNDPGRVLGLPAGLTYHVVYCLAVAAVLGLLVRHAWPAPLR